jgi:hypothetical protein
MVVLGQVLRSTDRAVGGGVGSPTDPASLIGEGSLWAVSKPNRSSIQMIQLNP